MTTDISGIPNPNAAAVEKAREAAAQAIKDDLVLESLLYSFMGSVAAQDGVLQGYMDEMDKQTETLALINEFMQIVNTIKDHRQNGNSNISIWNLGLRTSTGIQLNSPEALTKFVAKLEGVVTFPDGWIKLDIAMAEALLTELSTAQTSYGTLNEELSLKMNQAASSRTAMLTQLQTLLQTIMQARQQLARF